MSMGFIPDSTSEPLTVVPAPRKRPSKRFLLAGFAGLAAIAVGVVLTTGGNDPVTTAPSPSYSSVIVTTVPPEAAEAPTSQPYGTTIEINPGWTAKATQDGKVLFANNSDQPWFIGQYGFGYILQDGSLSDEGLGTDHWGVTLQPGEKKTSQLHAAEATEKNPLGNGLPENSTLVMVTAAEGPEQEVARWN